MAFTHLVKQGASIGAGAVLLLGLTIGEFAVVGAGSLVTRDVPPYVLVVGNPARIRGWVYPCGQRLKFRTASAACSACGRRFAKQEKEDQILKIQLLKYCILILKKRIKPDSTPHKPRPYLFLLFPLQLRWNVKEKAQSRWSVKEKAQSLLEF